MTKTSRAEIVKAACDLMRVKGYAATSMKDLAERVGLLKGSLYAHFASKEELVPEVLARTLAEIIGEEPAHADWKERYRSTLERFVSLLRDNGRCVGFHLAYGLEQKPSAARKAVADFFHHLRDYFAGILTPVLGAEAASDLATETITVLEGATLWIAVEGDEGPIKRMHTLLLARIEWYDREIPSDEVRRLLDRLTGDWRSATLAERSLAERLVDAEADLLNVRSALAGQIEAESCFR